MLNAANIIPHAAPSRGGNPSLTALVDALERLVRDSEEDFLDLGMNLQKVQQMSSAQRQKIAATMSLFKSDQDAGILQQISSYVQSSQQETQQAQQTAVDLCSDLAEMIRLMDTIAQKIQALERAGLFLHVIGINTGIECARHGQMEAMFKVVSQDTILLADQIRQTTETLLDQTARARAEEGRTMSGARKSIESLQGLARESKQATETALGKVAELIEYSLSMIHEVDRMAQNITTEINRVVMGIQFHDNLRQRIEHVNEVLLETVSVAEGSTEEEAGNAYLSLILQKAQLETLVGELEKLYQTQSQAVANILESISHLETRLDSMATERANDSSDENPVAVLMTGIAALEQLNSESLELGRGIRSSSERAEQIAADMHNSIQGTFAIANNVKINALNAIIKAAKFGRIGESMQVLAQGMVEVSKDTRGLIMVFDQMLEQLGKLVGSDGSDADDRNGRSAESAFEIMQIEQVFQNFREELRASYSDCLCLAQSLEREQQHLNFIVRLKEAIQQQVGQLDTCAEMIRPQNEELLADLRSSFGQQLEARYTMNEERVIHQKIQQSESSSAESQHPDAGSSDDVLFFDASVSGSVPAEPELWGAGPTGPDHDAARSGDEPSTASGVTETEEIELWDTPQADPSPDVELFDELPAETETIDLRDESLAAAPVTENDNVEREEDFGDNVELF